MNFISLPIWYKKRKSNLIKNKSISFDKNDEAKLNFTYKFIYIYYWSMIYGLDSIPKEYNQL